MEVRGQGSLVSSSRSRIVLPLVASLFAALVEQPPQLYIPRTQQALVAREQQEAPLSSTVVTLWSALSVLVGAFRTGSERLSGNSVA
jgi:hypothetical protein